MCQQLGCVCIVNKVKFQVELTSYFFVGATPKFEAGKQQVSATAQGPVAETFKAIDGALTPEVVKSTAGVYQFELSGKVTCKINASSLESQYFYDCTSFKLTN